MECEVDLWNLFVRLILHRSGCIVCPLFILPVHAGQLLYADLVPVDYAVVLVAGFKEAIVWWILVTLLCASRLVDSDSSWLKRCAHATVSS